MVHCAEAPALEIFLWILSDSDSRADHGAAGHVAPNAFASHGDLSICIVNPRGQDDGVLFVSKDETKQQMTYWSYQPVSCQRR